MDVEGVILELLTAISTCADRIQNCADPQATRIYAEAANSLANAATTTSTLPAWVKQ